MDKIADKEILELEHLVDRMHRCGCTMSQFRNPNTKLFQWALSNICRLHQQLEKHNYVEWQRFVKSLVNRFFEPSSCYCQCHQIHPEGLKTCEECTCWWFIPKNWDAELEKANAHEQSFT